MEAGPAMFFPPAHEEAGYGAASWLAGWLDGKVERRMGMSRHSRPQTPPFLRFFFKWN